jgi:hypothetical protein
MVCHLFNCIIYLYIIMTENFSEFINQRPWGLRCGRLYRLSQGNFSGFNGNLFRLSSPPLLVLNTLLFHFPLHLINLLKQFPARLETTNEAATYITSFLPRIIVQHKNLTRVTTSTMNSSVSSLLSEKPMRFLT